MSDKEKETEAKEKEARRKRAKAINARSVMMFRSKESIPRFVRYGMPIIILITIGLFVWTSQHRCSGCDGIGLAGDQIDVDNFFGSPWQRVRTILGLRVLASLLY